MEDSMDESVGKSRQMNKKKKINKLQNMRKNG
jgi:hypothetical protein